MIELLSEETSPNRGKTLADFKKAALSAFIKKFPHAEFSCCYFHLTQSFNRKINEIRLKTFYEDFPEFNLALRRLPALSHVVPAHVKATFEFVSEEIIQMEIIRSTYEFENAVPYLRARGKFR